MPTAAMYHPPPPPPSASSARSFHSNPTATKMTPPTSTSVPAPSSSHPPLQTSSTTTATLTTATAATTSVLSAPLPPSPSSSSMTLAISKNDATRIIEASRVFNNALLKLQQQEKKAMKECLKECQSKSQRQDGAGEGSSSMEVEPLPSSSSKSAQEKKTADHLNSSSAGPTSSSSNDDANQKAKASQAEEVSSESKKITVKEEVNTSSSSLPEEERDEISPLPKFEKSKKKDDISSSLSSIPSLKEEMSDDDLPPPLMSTSKQGGASKEGKATQKGDCASSTDKAVAATDEDGTSEKESDVCSQEKTGEGKEDNDGSSQSPQKKKLKKSESPTSLALTSEEKACDGKAIGVENESSSDKSQFSSNTSDDTGITSLPSQNQTATPLNKLLIPAAKQCSNPFLTSFVSKMEADENISEKEMEACLLLFLDMDKSSILLTAFAVLGDDGKEKSDAAPPEEKKKNESAPKSSTVATTNTVKMEEIEDMEITPTITADADEIMECDSSSSKAATKSPQEKDAVIVVSTPPPATDRHEEEKKEDEEDNVKASSSPRKLTPKGSRSATEDAVPPPSSSSHPSSPSQGHPKDSKPQEEDDDDEYFELPPEGKLTYDGLVLLFKSFLTSISTCIHHEQSPPLPQPSNNIPSSPKRTRSPSPHSVTFSPPAPTAAVSASIDEGDEDRPSKVKKDVADTSPSSAAKRAVETASPAHDSPPGLATVSNSMDNSSPDMPPAAGSTSKNTAAALTPATKNGTMVASSSPSSNSQDWTLSHQTKKEIQEIATYAADQLVLFLQNNEGSSAGENKKEGDKSKMLIKGEDNEKTTATTAVVTSNGTSENKDNINKENVLVSFEAFGEWYNAGGFSLVPWLELLDLAKWDYAGKAAAAAAEAAAREAASAEAVASAMNAPLDTPGGPASGNRTYRRLGSDSGFDSIPDDSDDRHHVDALDGFGPSPHPLTPTGYNDGRYSRGSDNSGRPSSSLRRRQPDPAVSAVIPPSTPEIDIFTRNKETSRTVVSFDFTASMPSPNQEFNINITEENLLMLKNVVHRTGLLHKSLEEISSVLLRYSIRKKLAPNTARTTSMGDCDNNVMILKRDDFGKCIRELVSPEYSKHFDDVEMENYSNYFTNFYTCFDKCSYSLGVDCANTKELAVGLSFLCAGNKSTKLSTAFELLDERCCGYLTQRGLTQYLRSYLTMLIGISLLSSSTSTTAETRKLLMSEQLRRSDIFAAVENGAKWTMGYFSKSFTSKVQQHGGRGGSSSTRCNAVTFEDFAEWYTEGGYTVAPWLELLDLSKFLSLLPEESSIEIQRSGSSGSGSGSQSHPKHVPPPHKVHPSEVLFTFPLANHQSLVVLREDAAYVRDVVTQLGLLSFSCDDIWSSMLGYIRKNPPYWQTTQQRRKNGQTGGRNTDVDQSTFVSAVDSIINPPARGNKKKQQQSLTSSEAKDTLKNFFSSFDLEQVDRVAVNQLMGGLTLLCGGKKSTKLAFSFGLFDGRTAKEKRKRGQEAQSLDKKELFLFFRSFLIVMFSCCKQSLDLSAEAVGRYISETANMVADDVVMYQWNTRRTDRVDFDNFGEWYNEGGYKTAPWLELLDLKKWVLLDGPIDAPPHKETRGAVPPTKHREEFGNSPPQQEVMDDKTQNAAGEAAAPTNAIDTKNEKNEETLSPAEDDQDCPPPPPDDAMDPANDPFLGDMGLDEIDGVVDDMDYILQQASTEASETQTKDSGDQQETSGKPIKEEQQEDTPAPAPSVAPANTKKQVKRQQKTDEKENVGNYVPNNSKARTKNRAKSAPSNNSRTQPHHNSHQQPPPGKSLKFHLLTNEEHGGYMVSISQRRIKHLRQLVCESGLYKLDGSIACDRILEKAVRRRQGSDSVLTLTKDEFDSAMRSVVSSCSSRAEAGMSTETQQYLSDLLTAIFRTFDRTNSGKVNALELACGFTVLCGGRKSDKLEYAFELLDEKKQGNYAHDDMIRYLQSFLLVLLSISSSSSLARDSREDVMTTMEGTHCGNSAPTILRAIDYGSTWATKQVFRSVLGANANNKGKNKTSRPSVCFDDFAEWYTRGGYTSIPWLELLDLRKWVLADKT